MNHALPNDELGDHVDGDRGALDLTATVMRTDAVLEGRAAPAEAPRLTS
jgi:hypothetical protein